MEGPVQAQFKPSTADTWELVYAVGANKYMTMSTIHILNAGSVDATFSLAYVYYGGDTPSPIPPSVAGYIEKDRILKPGESWPITEGHVLYGQNGIVFKASSTDVVCQAFGIEERI